MHRRAPPHWRAVRRCDARDEADEAMNGRKEPRMARINAGDTTRIGNRGNRIMSPIHVIRVIRGFFCIAASLAILICSAAAELPTPTLPSPFVVVDLSIGESQEVT